MSLFPPAMNSLQKSGCRNGPETDLIEILTLAKEYYDPAKKEVAQSELLAACRKVSQKDWRGKPIAETNQVTHACQLVKLSDEAQQIFLEEMLLNMGNSNLRVSLLRNVELHTIQYHTQPEHYSWPEVNYLDFVIKGPGKDGKKITKEMGKQLVVDFSVAAVVYKYIMGQACVQDNLENPILVAFLKKLQNLELKQMRGVVKKSEVKGGDPKAPFLLVYPDNIPALLLKEVGNLLKTLDPSTKTSENEEVVSDSPGEAFCLKTTDVGEDDPDVTAHFFVNHEFGKKADKSVSQRFATAANLVKDVVTYPVHEKCDFLFVNPPGA